MPRLDHSFRDGNRDGRAAEANAAHELQVRRGDVGVIEQARKEIRGPATRCKVVFDHRCQHCTRIPHIDQIDGLSLVDGKQQPTQHPNAMAYRCAHEEWRTAGLHGRELLDLKADRAM